MEYYKDGDLEIANPKLFGVDISLPASPVPGTNKQLFFEQAGARFSGQDLEAIKRLYEVSERLGDVELGGQCRAIDSSLEPLLQPAAPLPEYAWR